MRKFAVVVLLMATMATPVTAETGLVCADREKVLAGLEHAEQPVFIGLSADNTVIEVFLSKEGNWTILATMPNRMSCIAGVGKYGEVSTLLRGKGA